MDKHWRVVISRSIVEQFLDEVRRAGGITEVRPRSPPPLPSLCSLPSLPLPSPPSLPSLPFLSFPPFLPFPPVFPFDYTILTLFAQTTRWRGRFV